MKKLWLEIIEKTAMRFEVQALFNFDSVPEGLVNKKSQITENELTHHRTRGRTVEAEIRLRFLEEEGNV